MQTKLLFIRFVLFLVLFSCGTTFAQLSPYQGIINPYERYGGLGGSYGGVIIAEPDAVPSPLDNPAGIAFQRSPQMFAGMNAQFIKYDLNFTKPITSESVPWETDFTPGQIAASYPLNLLHREAALTFSLAKIPAPEIETGYSTKTDDYPDINHERTGAVGTATIGTSMKVAPTFSIGISYTRWLGSWTWEDKIINGNDSLYIKKYGKGVYKYDGNSFSLGIIKQINRFSFGTLLQSPFTLMHAKNLSLMSLGPEDLFELKQQFNGAATIGVSWRLSDNAKLGVSYRFQNDLKIVLKNYYVTDVEETIDIHKLSVAGEYTLQLENAAIPVYLAFQRSWLKESSDYIPGYLTTINQEEYQVQNSIQFGLNWHYKSIGVHFASQWQQYVLQVIKEPFPVPT